LSLFCWLDVCIFPCAIFCIVLCRVFPAYTFYGQVGDRAGEVAHYIPPLVVEELPFGVTATEFVAKLDPPADATAALTAAVAITDPPQPGASDSPQSLSALEDSLLSEVTGCQVAAIAGEGGSGKSTLLLRLGARLVEDGRAHLLRPAAKTQPAPWTPVLLELREYTAATLHGALCELVERVCGSDALAALQGYAAARTAGAGACAGAGAGASASASAAAAATEEPPRVRLLMLCDGADEMPDARPGALAVALRDLAATLCGGTAWPPAVLRVVVTTRGEVAPGAGLLRRILLPFGRLQVRRGTAGRRAWRW
jgi:hypothetical protein